MFPGNLIMRPVAYDAFSTGISGRTFAMPIAGTPPRAPSRDVRPESPCIGGAPASSGASAAPPISRGRGQCLAAEEPQFAQVAQVRLPAPIERQAGREPHGVVVSFE